MNYNAANETYDTIYKENRKYFFEIPEAGYDELKIKELDMSGVVIKGGIGLAF